ncbi:MAG: hypothetical protein OXH94_12815 [Rhodospirillales bacterium]|nr:hypothetical protein [Rhodospirillales bacterium]
MIPGKPHRHVIVAALLILTGCAAEVPVQSFPQITFRHLQPIDLRVADIRVDPIPPDPVPNDVTAGLPASPALALTQWARDRLRLAGSTRATARFTILAARVLRKDLEVEGGLTAVFKKQVDQRFDGVVEAEIEIVGERGLRRAMARAKAERVITVREDDTIAERRRKLFEMTEKMMADFDKEMEKAIRRHFVEWLF